MKKTTTIIFTMLFSLGLQAQDRMLSGKVTSPTDPEGVPGVSVVIPGTTKGVNTDVFGNYRIQVSASDTALSFSSIGYIAKTVGFGATDTLLNVVLDADVQNISEVVVTALGIKREEKSLGYAAQRVTGAEITTAKESNFINSLQGRVAGVTITGSSNIGGSSRILLRGVRSILYENQPLIVVDGIPINNSNFATRDQVRGALGYDYGNAAQDINPNDVETMNILKGSSATALYGTQGANGAVIITTKKGTPREKVEGRSPIGIYISSGISFRQVAYLPKYQNRYGGGASSDFITSNLHTDSLRSNFEYDGSWGPEMLGQPVFQWDSYIPSMPNYNKQYGWTAHPDNIEDFFETGISTDNQIALDGGNENTSFRFAYTKFTDRGTIPNSRINRDMFNFSITNSLTKQLSWTISSNYIASRGKARPQTGYSNLGSNFTQWWQRQLDMGQLEDYKNPDGTQRSWNLQSETELQPLYWDNPYWTCYENFETDQRDRLYGLLNLSYELTKGLTLSGSVKTDRYNEGRQERVAVGSAVASSISKYSEEVIKYTENNYELILSYQRSLNENFDLSALIGGNRQDRHTIDNFTTTQGGLNVPNYYNLTNSNANLLSDPFTEKLRRNSLYASASVGFRRFLYVDVTGRNDWSSTLPPENNSYFYPSITGSFVFSELLKLKLLSYGKVRASWSQTAIDPPPYTSGSTRPLVTDNFAGFATAVTPNTSNNPDLKPEKTRQWEIGTELSFLGRRLSVDFTYYNSLSKDVIFPVQQSAATGFDAKIYNAAEISNKGIELQLKGTPIQTKNGFEWGLGMNYAKNDNLVEKLYVDQNGKETESLLIENAPFSVTFQARPGMPYGQIVGYDYAYDANGNHIIDQSTGSYATTATVVPLGSTLPDFTGGFFTWLTFKSLRLDMLIDFQKGGKLFSLTNTWGKYSGTLEETAEGDIRENGLVLEGVQQTGVDENGNPISDGTPNTMNIAAVDHFFLDGGYVVSAADVYDATYMKLREITLTYTLPQRWFKKIMLQDCSISAFGRNLAILNKHVPNIDPESAVSSNNIQGLEGGQLPPVRTYGLRLSFTF